MTKNDYLVEQLHSELIHHLTKVNASIAYDEVTLNLEDDVKNLPALMLKLRDTKTLAFDELIDLCGVDYLYYGQYDWETEAATESGFSRGVEYRQATAYTLDKPRFAVVYHLLSTELNHRLRVKVFLHDSHLAIPSVHEVWKGANWFEREAYDLYGILFENHPDLRRILTDYGFIGHPFRKDFPLSGQVEMHYDARLGKVIYAPVDITPRTLIPKVIRHDNRYLHDRDE